jgi:hypothetical protein
MIVGNLIQVAGQAIGEFLINGNSMIVDFAKAILALLIMFELLEEALDIASGRGFNLDKKLITYAIVFAFLIGYPRVSHGLWNTSQKITIVDKMHQGAIHLINKEVVKKANEFKNILKSANNGDILKNKIQMMDTFLLINMFGINFIGFIFLGIQLSFALTLYLGPLFIVFFMSPLFRNTGMTWINNTLSYFLALPISVLAVNIMAKIYLLATPIIMSELENKIQSKSIESTDLFLLLLFLIPFLIVFVMISFIKVVMSLLGGSGGITGTQAAMGMGSSMGFASSQISAAMSNSSGSLAGGVGVVGGGKDGKGGATNGSMTGGGAGGAGGGGGVSGDVIPTASNAQNSEPGNLGGSTTQGGGSSSPSNGSNGSKQDTGDSNNSGGGAADYANSPENSSQSDTASMAANQSNGNSFQANGNSNSNMSPSSDATKRQRTE